MQFNPIHRMSKTKYNKSKFHVLNGLKVNM